MFVVASKEAGLGFEKSDVRRLSLVSVSRRARGGCGGRVDVVMPRSGQLYYGRRGNERTYFPPCGDVAYRRRGRCLYFLGMIAFGCELLAKVFYCLQTCAFANGCLFFDASRLLPYKRSAQTRSVDFEYSTLIL